MSASKHTKDEHLERLWYMKERGTDTLDDLRRGTGGEFDPAALRDLEADGLARVDDQRVRVALTPAGETEARRIVRAHRIGERLIFDAFGSDFEPGACEFEHTVTPELVDGICILLGHPKECPHGLPIPPGECCRTASRVVESLAVPLTELRVGESGRVVYVQCRDDRLLHRIDGLQIRPGATIRVHQEYPSFVVECEGASIALSPEVARNICVWASPRPRGPGVPAVETGAPRRRGWLGRLFAGRGR
ncbi:MAG: metal-dependent transcriptional regulator [Deferrisomatales bacterium]